MLPLLILLALLPLGMAQGERQAPTCPDLSGNYTIQYEDGRISISVIQTGCESITISTRTICLGKGSTESHRLKLDGKLHEDSGWDGDKAKVQTAVDDLKRKMESGNLDDIRKGIDALTQASHKIAEAMYQQASKQHEKPAGEQGPPPGGESGPKPKEDKGKKDDIVDADFEVVDDDKDK